MSDQRRCTKIKLSKSKDVYSVILLLPAAPAGLSEPAAHFLETLHLSASAGNRIKTHPHTHTQSRLGQGEACMS